MANPYFTPSGAPPTQTRGISASMRGEFNAIGTGFDGVYAQLVALAAAIGVPVTVTEVPVASGSTTDIGNGYGPVISITGTTTINSFGANYNGAKFLRFTGILTLTNSASLVLPGGANITTAAGDACIAIPIGNPASGWRVLSYCRMSKPMLDDDAIRASVSYSNPSWLTSLAWSKISGTPTTRAGYGIVDAAGNGNNSDITSLSGLSGNIAFTGTGSRITGDFSNATFANRVAIQSSTLNGETQVGLLPNGISTTSALMAFNAASPANAGYGALWALSTDIRLDAGITGTGTYLPLTLYAGGAERVRIDNTTGNFGIGAAPSSRLHITGSNVSLRFTNANGVPFTRALALADTDNSFRISRPGVADDIWIDSTGKVSIGTGAAPTYSLDVAGASGVQARFKFSTGGTAQIQSYAGGVEFTSPDANVIYGTSSASGTTTIYAGGSGRFVFGASGQFGIAGANYGTTGQSIFSGGASAAPSWSSLSAVGGAFVATRTTNQTSGNVLILDTVNKQVGGTNYASGTGVFTAPVAGWYSFSCSLGLQNGGGALAQGQIQLNTNGIASGWGGYSVAAGTSGYASVSAIVYMTAGQIMEVYSSTAFTASFYALANNCVFQGCYLGA